VTDEQTDGIAMAYTCYSIYAVACKNQSIFSDDMDNSRVSPFFDSRCIISDNNTFNDVVKTEAMYVGRKTQCVFVAEILLTRLKETCFHWWWTEDVARDKVNRYANGVQKSGAPSLRKQVDSWSRPMDVGSRVSGTWKIRHSV